MGSTLSVILKKNKSTHAQPVNRNLSREIKMINKYSRDMLRAVLLILAATLAQPALSAEETAPTKSDMEELRDKIYADKKLIVSENMDLTEEEASKFWPIYQAYQEDLHKINERMAKLINEYALSYNKGAILDKTARQLIDQAIDIEMDEAKLRKSYVPKLSKVLPGAKVARYMQIENKIRAIVRYELASAIPLAY
jgi:Spy/CpxP family protein refolding chaperone